MVSLESCSQKPGILQAFHPALKVIITLVFAVCVMSCTREETERLVPNLLMLCVFLGMSSIPLGLYFRRLLWALPFALFTGIWGCFWDFEPVMFWGWGMTGGLLSLISILLRTLLSVGAVFILVGTTPLGMLSQGMRQLKMPPEMVMIFELMCRYLGILIDEAKRLQMAWVLRGGDRRGIGLMHFGSFAGGLLIRSFQRASRIYRAMLCRGYDGDCQAKGRKPTGREWVASCVIIAMCLWMRICVHF